MKIFKIILLLIFIAAIAMAGYVYLNRHTIFDYNINKLVKSLMPKYIEVGELNFDLQSRKITIKNFKIKNADGFVHDYLAEIPEVHCVYTQKNDENILEGISIKDIDLIRPSIFIVRQEDSQVSVARMEDVFKEEVQESKGPSLISKLAAYLFYQFSPVKKIEDLVEIEPVFNLKGGKFIFDDFYFDKKGYKTTIEQIEGKVELTLKKDLKGIEYIRTKGVGFVNGERPQKLKWNTEYNPKTPKLTMANSFDISNIDFIHFKPYYDKFSPFIFKQGRASGELIFDFDNGDIGSTNEVRFSGLDFEAKGDQGYESFWAASAQDLQRYFSSASGELVFDFKIKGPMEKPKFYLGPKAKRALTKMVVYRITDTLFKKDEPSQAQGETQPSPTQQGEKSDVEQIIDIFKNIKNSYGSKE
ncbi:MAG: hypothetical protein ABH843_03940 [Candidatus Omnitrophota bacterium]